MPVSPPKNSAPYRLTQYFTRPCRKRSGQFLSSLKKVHDLNPKIIYAGHDGLFIPEAVRRRFLG